jgi:hypothetical protein
MKYVQVGPLPNIVTEASFGEKLIAEAWETLEPMRKELIEILAPKYPHYQFCVGGVHLSVGVTHEGNRVGAIYRGGGEFRLYSRAIEVSGPRGIHGKRTKDAAKAVKLFHKYFVPPTHTDVIKPYLGATEAFVRRIRSKETLFVDNVKKSLAGSGRNEVHGWLSVIDECRKVGLMSDKAADALLDMAKDLITPAEVRAAYNSPTGCNVVIREGYYYVHSRKTNATVRYTQDTLPTNIKQCVGMLKLVPPDTVVGEVGIQIDANNFYVLEELA